jgi:hypothetical protein
LLPEITLNSRGMPVPHACATLPGRADLHAHGWGSSEKICLYLSPLSWWLLDRLLGKLLCGHRGPAASRLLRMLDADDTGFSIKLQTQADGDGQACQAETVIGKPRRSGPFRTIHLMYKPPLKPDEQYRLAKKNGMSLVVFTDHERIQVAQQYLNAHPANDCILGVELPVFMGYREEKYNYFHINVLGLSAAQHRQITEGWEARDAGKCLLFDPDRLFAYLNDERLFFMVNHLTFLQRPDDFQTADLIKIIRHPGVRFFELNAAWGLSLAKLAQDLVLRHRPAGLSAHFVAGGDSHYDQIGRSYVAAPESDPQGFLECLKRGKYINHLCYWEPCDLTREALATFEGGLKMIIAGLHQQGFLKTNEIPGWSLRRMLFQIMRWYLSKTVNQLFADQHDLWRRLRTDLMDHPSTGRFLMPPVSTPAHLE